MPVIGDELNFGTDLVRSLEAFRDSEVHWVVWEFCTSRERAELKQAASRLHDGCHPWARLHELRHERLLPKGQQARAEAARVAKKVAADALRARIEAAAARKNMVGRPLAHDASQRSSVPGYDLSFEDYERRLQEEAAAAEAALRGDDDEESGSESEWEDEDSSEDDSEDETAKAERLAAEAAAAAVPSFENMPVTQRYAWAEFLEPDDLLVLGLTSCAWYELSTSEYLWTCMALNLRCHAAGDHRSWRRQKQAVAFASFTGSANPNTARPGASSGNGGNGHDSDDDDEEDAPRRTARGLASARGNNSGFLSSRGQQQQPHSARNGSSSARNTGRMGESGIRPLPADGRQWAAACLFASRFRDLVSALPKDQSRFALVDFAHCPGLLDLAPSSASATATAAGYGMAPAVAATAGGVGVHRDTPPQLLPTRRGKAPPPEPGKTAFEEVGVHLSSGRPPRADDLPTAHQYRGADVSRNGSAHAPAGFWGAHEPPQGGDFPKLAAPVVLVFWDPIGPGPSARLPQLMHLARIQSDWEASWRRPFAPGWASVVDSTGGTRGRLADGGTYIPPQPEQKDSKDDDSDTSSRRSRDRRRHKGIHGEPSELEQEETKAHAQKERAGGGWFRCITHVLHARRPEDLDFDRVVAWLSSGLGLQGKACLQQEGVWDVPLYATAEFQQALAGIAAEQHGL